MQPSVLSSMPYRVVARGSEDKTCEIGLLQLRGTTLTNGQSRRWFVACRTVFGRAGSHARQQHVVCTWLVFFAPSVKNARKVKTNIPHGDERPRTNATAEL